MTPPTDETPPKPVSIEANEPRDFDVYRSLREEAGPDYWPVSTLADFFGVHVSTLRAQTKSERIPPPSMRAVQGHLSLQLYTLKDALQVQEYYVRTQKTIKRQINPRRNLGEQEW